MIQEIADKVARQLFNGDYHTEERQREFLKSLEGYENRLDDVWLVLFHRMEPKDYETLYKSPIPQDLAELYGELEKKHKDDADPDFPKFMLLKWLVIERLAGMCRKALAESPCARAHSLVDELRKVLRKYRAKVEWVDGQGYFIDFYDEQGEYIGYYMDACDLLNELFEGEEVEANQS